MQQICHLLPPPVPPVPQPRSGNRRLTAQHAVQISSGSENVSQPGVEASAGACQLPGPSSCTLMSFPSEPSEQISQRDHAFKLLTQQTGRFVLRSEQPGYK